MFEIPQFDPARDMRAPAFADILSGLEPHTEISDKWMRLKPKKRLWYTSQQQHMEAWFSQAEGPGAYGRSRSQTAGQTFNRLLCPPALLWIGEALGVEHEIMRAAANAAWGQKRLASQCGAIRRHVSWKHIFELAQDHL